MADPLYRVLQEIRAERGELLKDMADKLGLGSAELSAIEHAKKPIPKYFIVKLKFHYPEYAEKTNRKEDNRK